MSNPSSPAERYRSPAIALHWLIALLIFVGFGMGQFMSGLEMSPGKLQLFSWHKWIGVTVFLLAVLRVAWRVGHRPPPAPAGMPRWQHRAAEATHGLLYLLMFGIPLSGWLMSSASGYQTVYFGVLPLPDLVGESETLATTFKLAHVAQCNVLLALVVLHMAAAIKHQYIDGDGLIARMAPVAKGIGLHLSTAAAIAAFAIALSFAFGGEEHEHEGTVAAVPAVSAVVEPIPTADVTPEGELTVSFSQMGVSVGAEFSRYAVDIVFEPTAPERSSIAVRVDVNSFDIGDSSYNAEILSPAWLDGAAHPLASFRSERIESSGDGAYVAHGRFELKGVSQPVAIPFSLSTEADGRRRYGGRFDISRKAFGVGSADWDDSVEDRVTIAFVVMLAA